MAKRSKGNVSLAFLGGAGGVTGSKFLTSFDDQQILIDCGLFQGLKELRLRNWAPPPLDPARLKAIVLTHGHIDHSGYLPRIVARGFHGRVLATPATCDLLKILLLDAAHLQEEEARYANKKGYSKHHPALPLYTVEDAERALTLLWPTKIGDEALLGDGIGVQFSPVGHILGAAAARLGYDLGGRKKFLVDSGDLGRYGRPILKDPEPVKSADWLLVESTYGDRLHAKDPESEIAAIVNEVAERAGILIIPSFAVGRTQDLIYTLRALEDAGRIPALPLHVDSPMAIEATDIYSNHKEEHDLDMRLVADNDRDPLRSRRFFVHRTPEESKR